MILRRCLAVFAVVSLASASSAIACSGTTASGDGGVDARSDRMTKDRAPDVREAKDAGADVPCVDGGPEPVLIELSVTKPEAGEASPPVTLVPAFSPYTHDYYVRCPSATNTLRVSMTPSCGAEGGLSLYPPSGPRQTISPLDVLENQAIVATAQKGSTAVEYWVRCLPPDFPDLQLDAHPEAGAPAPGYYLVGNFISAGASGGYAMVLNGDGVPVWYYHETSGGVSDVDDLVDGTISFFPVVGGPLQITEVSSGDASSVGRSVFALDWHEVRALSNGHFLLITHPNVTGVDLTGLSLPGDAGLEALGPGSNINDCVIVELDPTSNGIVWTWSVKDHFDAAKACTEPERAPPLSDGGVVIDTFHCNSIDVDPANGNLVVSARQMDSAFYIDRSTDKVIWKMGGSPDSLDNAMYIPVADPFYEQHDVRLQPGWSSCTGGQISLFDDETRRPGPARAVLYDVAFGPGDGGCLGATDAGGATATVHWQYSGVSRSAAAGSFRIAPDGSRLIGWGLQPANVFTELDAKGVVLLELHSAYADGLLPMESYRAIKVPTSAYDLDAMRRTAGQ
jgi:hypothetical protein